MNLQRKFRFGALGILAGFVLSVVPLSAQEIYKANFELPFAARWNGVVLEQGEYTVTIEQGLAMRLIRIRGEGQNLIRVAGPYKEEPVTEHGHLTFANVGGAYVLQQFDAGALGQSFSFAKPKGLQGQSAHSSELTRDTVVVSTR